LTVRDNGVGISAKFRARRVDGEYSASPGSLAAPAPNVDLTGLTILVVDDEPDTREQIASLLGGCGAAAARGRSLRPSAERCRQARMRRLPVHPAGAADSRRARRPHVGDLAA
jgi:hypothetical protein